MRRATALAVAATSGLMATLGWFGSAEADPSCPARGADLLFHSCWGEARADLLLLPEDAASVNIGEAAQTGLVVTGAYTGKDTRANGHPNPVGLFIDDGQIVNPNAARMDGILLLDQKTGQASLHHRAHIRLGEAAYDLTEPETRRVFAERARDMGVSVLQSHLLVTNGQLDVRETEDAPSAVRRIFFVDEAGWGVWQSQSPLTLYDAALELLEARGPKMALNLDMGSYDYCFDIRDGEARSCGVLAAGDTRKLSNLLRFSVSSPR